MHETLLCAWGEGELCMEMLLQLISIIIESEKKVQHPLNRFIDLSLMKTVSIEFEKLLPLAENRRRAVIAYGDVKIKVAIYATTPVSFGKSRMYDTLMTSDNVEVQIFRDLLKVAEWLNIRSELLQRPE